MSANVPPPSPESQLTFLSKLQRLFAEGDFTATYKYALLISLADLAVELGADDGRELLLTTRQIGERFIYLYWRQATPYGTGKPSTEPNILSQNLGAQAAVVSAVARFRAAFAIASPQAAKSAPGYNVLLSSVSNTVSAQPLSYLQNFGGGTDEFLYERAGNGKVRLKPGVSYCLRRFQPLVQQLARAHWTGHIKGNRRNLPILGEGDDLEAFLFETPRQSLVQLGASLRKLEGAKCFYCGGALTDADVDHFIPFSQYPRDLSHNFVLAHPGCNRSKSDTLAARPHLERWLERLALRSDDIQNIGLDAGMVADAAISRQVVAWGYAGAVQSGSRAWHSPNLYEVVDQSYSMLFTS
ncbi:HNH endonuclease [Noviherbaspirillum malthae]|uniref:HNH endonuclease n=1 Tax=Noviherbaspirillum malthae TaxID=1260987 RepID=UPI00188E1468|nr:HNH endonuclease domain-containing protein [Noviherbaspirillum malthae]